MKPTETGPNVKANSTLSRESHQMASSGPFQPKLVCNSMNLGRDNPQSIPRVGLRIEGL